jgi:hypothetical protein
MWNTQRPYPRPKKLDPRPTKLKRGMIPADLRARGWQMDSSSRAFRRDVSGVVSAEIGIKEVHGFAQSDYG